MNQTFKELINSENFFKKEFNWDQFKTSIETIEKICKFFYDKEKLQKNLLLQEKLSQISWLTKSEFIKYEELKTKIDYINNRLLEQKKLEKLRIDSNLSVENNKKYQKFFDELKYTYEIEIDEKDKKEFEKLELKLKSREKKIFSEIDMKPLENLCNILFIKWEFDLDFRNKKEKIIFDSVFSVFEKEEIFNLLCDFEIFWIIKQKEWKFQSKIASSQFTFSEISKLIFDFVIPIIYYSKIEDFEFGEFDLKKLKWISFEFWNINNEVKEKNEIIINEFFNFIFSNLKKSNNLRKIIYLKDFCKNLSFDLNFEDEIKEIEKEIQEKNWEKKRIQNQNWKRIQNILFSQYMNYEKLFDFDFKKENSRLLNVDISFIPLIKMFVNLWIFEKNWFTFKIKEWLNLKKWFFLELLSNISEIIYKKFEEELPWPLLEQWIWLIWRFKDWKKKNFSLINSFWIDFTKFDSFKEDLLDRWFLFIEKNSLWQSKDIFVFIKESWKITNENVIINQLIKKYEEDLIKINEFKQKEFKNQKENKSDVLKKAIEELKQRQQIIEKQEIQEENFWNVENINETFNWRIFYWIDEEKEFFRISEEDLSEAYKRTKFFTYVFTKEEHKISDYQFDIAILYDKQIKKDDLQLIFVKYLMIKDNKDWLFEFSNFYYSKVIWTTSETKYKELRKFFKSHKSLLLLKTMNIVNSSTWEKEIKYIGWNNYEWLLKSFDWLSIQEFWEFLNSDEWQEIWRYNIYKKNSWNDDWISYLLMTRKVIKDRETYSNLFKWLNKAFNLWIQLK